MSQRDSGYARKERDLYETPRWVTEALRPHLPDLGGIWEPACGSGKMLSVLEIWGSYVLGSDIHTGADFLFCPSLPEGSKWDAIITNPPYSLAQEFVERAKLWRASERSLIVMLLRVNFLGSQKRGAWLRANTPSVYVSPRRPSFGTNKDGKRGTDATEYAWFIWGPDKPTIGILNTDESESLSFWREGP